MQQNVINQAVKKLTRLQTKLSKHKNIGMQIRKADLRLIKKYYKVIANIKIDESEEKKILEDCKM